MPVLGPADPLVTRPSRVLVAGATAAGKTSWASRIAQVLGVPQIEIDALYHGPGWQKRPTFVEDVERFAAQPAWVTEWLYDSVRPLLAERADLVVWLDLPTAVVMTQVVRRTWHRRWNRTELWNGNVEPPWHTLLTCREHIVRLAWSTRKLAGQRVAALLEEDPERVVVRLTSHDDARRWLDGPLTAATAG